MPGPLSPDKGGHPVQTGGRLRRRGLRGADLERREAVSQRPRHVEGDGVADPEDPRGLDGPAAQALGPVEGGAIDQGAGLARLDDAAPAAR